MRVKFVETHGPIFLGGKNHKNKLFATDGVTLEHVVDENGENILMSYNNRQGYIPISNVVIWEPQSDKTRPAIVNEHKPMDVKKIKTAQVSGPHDHVFQGEGAGKTKR